MSKGVFQEVRGFLGDNALTHLAQCSVVWGRDISAPGRGLRPGGLTEVRLLGALAALDQINGANDGEIGNT